MKKVIAKVFVLFAVLFATQGCENKMGHMPIDFDQLPNKAQNTITTYFQDEQISYVVRDMVGLIYSYECISKVEMK